MLKLNCLVEVIQLLKLQGGPHLCTSLWSHQLAAFFLTVRLPQGWSVFFAFMSPKVLGMYLLTVPTTHSSRWGYHIPKQASSMDSDYPSSLTSLFPP